MTECFVPLHSMRCFLFCVVFHGSTGARVVSPHSSVWFDWSICVLLCWNASCTLTVLFSSAPRPIKELVRRCAVFRLPFYWASHHFFAFFFSPPLPSRMKYDCTYSGVFLLARGSGMCHASKKALPPFRVHYFIAPPSRVPCPISKQLGCVQRFIDPFVSAHGTCAFVHMV